MHHAETKVATRRKTLAGKDASSTTSVVASKVEVWSESEMIIEIS